MGTTGIFVLPFAEVVRQLENFEELLAFYPGGVKSVIRDALPLVDGRRVMRHRAGNFISEWETASLPILLDKVMRVYESSAEAVVTRIMENTSASPYIELVVEKIYREAQMVMSSMFSFVPVTVSSDEGCWLGEDYVAWVTLHDHFVPSGL